MGKIVVWIWSADGVMRRWGFFGDGLLVGAQTIDGFWLGVFRSREGVTEVES